MLVRIIKDWDKRDDLFKQTPNHSGKWGKFEFTEEPVDQCDAVVVLNRSKVDICVTTRLLMVIQMEPPTPAHAWYKKSYPYADILISQFEKVNHPNQINTHGALPWHIAKSYDELQKMDFDLQEKKLKLSMITSDANWMEGHEYRLGLANYLMEQNFDFALFGKGYNYVKDKWDAHFAYQYSLVIENSFYPNYWTEKIVDALLAFSVPIYIGSPNINEFFPTNSVIRLEKSSYSKIHEQLSRILLEDDFESRIASVIEARNRILNRYQLFPFINGHLERIKEYNLKEVHIPGTIAPWEKEGRIPLKRKIEYQIRKFMNNKPF